MGCSCCSPAIAWDAQTPGNATAEPVVPVPAGVVCHAVAWKRLSWRCWLAESSASGQAVPTQSPCVPWSGCRASAQEMLLLRSAALGARRGEGVTWCLPCFVPAQAWAVWRSRGRRGGISGGSFAALSLLKEHHVPTFVGITRHSEGLPVATGT